MKELKTGEGCTFLAALTWLNGNRVDVPCKLFLPKKVEDPPRIIFQVNDDQFHVLVRAGLCELTAELGEDAESLRIEASELRISGGNLRHLGDGLNDGYILGHPRSLKLIRRLPEKANGTSKATFMLTESRQLSPYDSRILHSDGSVECRWRGARIQFQLADGLRLTFDHDYKFDTSEAPITRMWPELVATLDIGEAQQSMDFETLLLKIDELLLLVSLAEGQGCACLQALWYSGPEAVHSYRLDRAVPTKKRNHSFNDFLIEHNGLLPFLNLSYRSLCSSSQRDLLRSALASMTYFEPATIQEEFLRLFSALESLVLAFRRDHGLELVLDEGQCKTLGKDLQKVLKSHPTVKDDKTRKAMLYENLSAINRVSFRAAMQELVSQNGIDIDDVWPLLDSKDGWSLLMIRNKLVHGDYFSEPEWGFIIDAIHCLRLIAQRILLCMLGWDYKNSRAGYCDAWINWRSSRENLSKHRG
jgi:hypothetical protein